MSVARSAFVLILAGTALPAFADQITCRSTGNRPEPCGTVEPGSSVTLAQQLGPTPCVEGRNWGTGPDRDSIWVSSGCSAVFDVRPPAGSRSDDRMAGGGNGPAAGGRSPEWRRGYGDGRRGDADPNATSQDYLEGFRAGEDAARETSRYATRGASPQSSDNPGVFEPVPNPPTDRRGPDDYANRGPAPPPDRYPPPGDDRYPPPGYREPPPDVQGSRRDAHYASIDQNRSIARRACIDAAAQDRRYEADRIISRDVHWIGHGDFEVILETPEGGLVCTVDRDGNVQSIDQR